MQNSGRSDLSARDHPLRQSRLVASSALVSESVMGCRSWLNARAGQGLARPGLRRSGARTGQGRHRSTCVAYPWGRRRPLCTSNMDMREGKSKHCGVCKAHPEKRNALVKHEWRNYLEARLGFWDKKLRKDATLFVDISQHSMNMI